MKNPATSRRLLQIMRPLAVKLRVAVMIFAVAFSSIGFSLNSLCDCIDCECCMSASDCCSSTDSCCCATPTTDNCANCCDCGDSPSQCHCDCCDCELQLAVEPVSRPGIDNAAKPIFTGAVIPPISLAQHESTTGGLNHPVLAIPQKIQVQYCCWLI